MTVVMIIVLVAAVALLIWPVRERRRMRTRHASPLDEVELEQTVCRQLYGTQSSTVTRVPRPQARDDRVAA